MVNEKFPKKKNKFLQFVFGFFLSLLLFPVIYISSYILVMLLLLFVNVMGSILSKGEYFLEILDLNWPEYVINILGIGSYLASLMALHKHKKNKSFSIGMFIGLILGIVAIILLSLN